MPPKSPLSSLVLLLASRAIVIGSVTASTDAIAGTLRHPSRVLETEGGVTSSSTETDLVPRSLATGVDALVLNWLIDTTQARLAEERLCNNEDERECLDSCVMLGKCEDERYDFNAQMDCKQECQVKCCRHQVKKDSLFSKRPIRVKQDAGINASEYIVPLSSEPMENMCSTAEERACREMCFDDKKCDDDDEDCKKPCRTQCCDEPNRSRINNFSDVPFRAKLCNNPTERTCREQCFVAEGCAEFDEECKKPCRFGCCEYAETDIDITLCNTFSERQCRNDCFVSENCNSADDADCVKLCQYRCCDIEDDRLCNSATEKNCRNKCFYNEECDPDDELCLKKCRFECCEEENDGMCNFMGEKECRQECFIDNACDDDSDCQKDCRFACCDWEDENLCNTSDERLCRTMCFMEEKCADDDEACLKGCRQDCCEDERRNDPSDEPPVDIRSGPTPTFAPTSGAERLCNGISRQQRANVIRMRLSLISQVSDLVDLQSPQGKAYQWILAEDDAQLCPLDANLEQRYALAVVYFATDGKDWTSCSKGDRDCPVFPFLSAESECSWYGVDCNFNNDVDTLDLGDNNLNGEIPPEIRALKWLDVLVLESNRLKGTIPNGFNEGLVRLRLNNNLLEGEVPAPLPTSLFALYLNNNRLSGTLDGVIDNLPDMRQLQLQNNLFEGTIPASLSDMNNLRNANFEGNNLSGNMPSKVCDLKEVRSGLTLLAVDCDEVRCLCCDPACAS